MLSASRYLAILGVFLFGIQCSFADDGAEASRLRQELDNLQRAGDLAAALDRAEQLAAVFLNASGPISPERAAITARRATLLQALGRLHDAKASFIEAREIAERAFGPDHVNVSSILNDTGLLYKQMGDLKGATELYRRALEIRERTLGPEHPAVGLVLSNQAALLVTEGRFNEAAPLFRRAIAISENAYSTNGDPELGRSLNNLATLYWAQGRFAEAEPLFKRALGIIEGKFGPAHVAVSAALNNIAALYQDQGRASEAEPLFLRSLAIREAALGPTHKDVGESANALAWFYHKAANQLDKAEPLYQRAISITENAIGPEHATVGALRNNLAVLYFDQKRYAEAEPLFRRAIAIRQTALGIRHSDVGQSMYRLACLYKEQGRLEEALDLHEDALEIRIAALGPQHPDVVQSLDSVAELFEAQKQWRKAVDISRRARDIVVNRAKNGALSGTAFSQESGRREIALGRRVFARLVRSLWHDTRAGGGARGALAEAFLAANWADQTEAGAALAQMSLRQAKGDGRLANLVREQQDLGSRWQALDRQLYASVARDIGERKGDDETKIRSDVADVERQRASVDDTIRREFPEYFELAQPNPLSIVEVQKHLRPKEILLQYLVTDQDVFIFAISNRGSRWARSKLDPASLSRHVATLRCGLDGTAWADEACRQLLNLEPIEVVVDNERFPVLPFSARHAHAMYADLVKPFTRMGGERLLVVATGPLASLPFHVLLTQESPVPIVTRLTDFDGLPWLGTRSAITVLPTASSLRALRQFVKPGQGKRQYIGFGNPELDGSDPDLARAARQRQTCSDTAANPSRIVLRGAKKAIALSAIMRSGNADVANLRTQSPLPETADELCDVAHGLGVADDEVKLGQHATESVIKDLSDAGTLAQYRVVHFATHGVLAGQVTGAADPGLILTPPREGDLDAEKLQRDDGYLSASEIATLKLDADWVILSACNTAAADGHSSEALSGLARAFFYAGSHSLLVSHWEVSSIAAVKLTTRTLSLLRSDATNSRSEALRRSMRNLMKTGSMIDRHPSQWAPFVVVGEGY